MADKAPVADKESARDKCLLLVEDSQMQVQLVSRLAAALGLEMVHAPSGEAALKLAAAREFDLVLMDLQLTALSGLSQTALSGIETARKLTARQTSCPVIGLTAYLTPEDERAGKAAGMKEVLAKPLEAATLERLMKLSSSDSQWGSEEAKTDDELLAPDEAVGETDDDLPVFDRVLAMHNAGNRLELVRQLMDTFVSELDDTQAALKEAASDPAALKREVHKLHGGLHYCGLPRLKNAVAQLESLLKAEEDYQQQLAQCCSELEAVKVWHQANPDLGKP